MTVTVRQVAGPDPAFLCLEGSVEGFPQCTATRSISLAALASGALTVAAEKAALIAQIETNHTNWLAAQAALQEL
jgi:hypothetical protein